MVLKLNYNRIFNISDAINQNKLGVYTKIINDFKLLNVGILVIIRIIITGFKDFGSVTVLVTVYSCENWTKTNFGFFVKKKNFF